jgi:hypothetical protein
MHNLAKWDGTNWSAVGGGVAFVDSFFVSCETVRALVFRDGKLYVGGYFNIVGGEYIEDAVANIASWDGTNWCTYNGGVGNSAQSSVDAIALSGTNLYVGGRFSTANAPGQSVSAK